jgi:hypothetical protein
MKVGVIFAVYNCSDYVEKCVSPWFKLKENHDIITTVTSGRFKDYIELGIPNKNTETLQKLVQWNFDFLSITHGERLLDEDSSRNLCLNFLKPFNCDLIWLVDGDEFYTELQIESILEYIKNTPDKEAYSIWLKNYTIKYPLFTNWKRPSIYRNRLYGGISRFYFDSYFMYNDEIHGIKDVLVEEIPKSTAFVEHYTWLETEATKDKIHYQNMRYTGIQNENPEGCRCSFEFDEDGLKFSESFFLCRGVPIPTLNEHPSNIIDSSFFLGFIREENKITISTEEKKEKIKIQVKDLDSSKLFNEFFFPLMEKNVEYWIIPLIGHDFTSAKGFIIDIFEGEDQKLIHTENIHLKIK